MRMHLLIGAVSICTPLFARAQGITDYSSRKTPVVTLPSAGGSYTDPVFGTKIIRVTDSRYGTICTHAYNYWPAFNHDDTRLLLACDDKALLFRFDPATDTVTADGTLQGSDGPHVRWEGAVWSYSSPDFIFAVDQKGTRLWKMDVSKRGAAGYTLLRDFATKLPANVYIAQMTMSNDSNVFSFHTRDRATDKALQAVVWIRDIDKTYLFPLTSSHALNESKIDKLGHYAMVNYNDEAMALWDFRAGAAQWFSMSVMNDDVGGHYDIGQDFIVNSGNWHAGVVGRTFSSLRPPDVLVPYRRTDGTENWTLCDHVSLRELNEIFFVGSTYLGDGTNQPFENEVYLGYLDGHGFVRLAHTRSRNLIHYYSQPRATVDMKGRYVVFTSDLGSSSRTDVMIVKIPRAYWP